MKDRQYLRICFDCHRTAWVHEGGKGHFSDDVKGGPEQNGDWRLKNKYQLKCRGGKKEHIDQSSNEAHFISSAELKGITDNHSY